MGANTKPMSGASDTLGVIGRDLGLPRHDHYPKTGRWRWQELEMRLDAESED